MISGTSSAPIHSDFLTLHCVSRRDTEQIEPLMFLCKLSVDYRSKTICNVVNFQIYCSHFIITVKQEFYHMSNGQTYKIHNKIPPIF